MRVVGKSVVVVMMFFFFLSFFLNFFFFFMKCINFYGFSYDDDEFF